MRGKEPNYIEYKGNISEEPVPSKEETAYRFTVSEERSPYRKIF